MSIDTNVIWILSGLVVTAIIRTWHASVIYTKLRAKLDTVASNCITIQDAERWQSEWIRRNPTHNVPDIVEIVLRRKQLANDDKIPEL